MEQGFCTFRPRSPLCLQTISTASYFALYAFAVCKYTSVHSMGNLRGLRGLRGRTAQKALFTAANRGPRSRAAAWAATCAEGATWTFFGGYFIMVTKRELERRREERDRQLYILTALNGAERVARCEQRVWLTMTEICDLCQIPYTPHDAAYIRKCLSHSLACETRLRVGGKRRAWFFPVLPGERDAV